MKFIKIITYMLAVVTLVFACYTFLGKGDKQQRAETSAIVNVER